MRLPCVGVRMLLTASLLFTSTVTACRKESQVRMRRLFNTKYFPPLQSSPLRKTLMRFERVDSPLVFVVSVDMAPATSGGVFGASAGQTGMANMRENGCGLVFGLHWAGSILDDARGKGKGVRGMR